MNRTQRQSIRCWFSSQMCYALAAVLAVFAPVAAAQNSSNVVIQWNNAALQGVRDGTLGPPMVARALAIVHTCMYDAWAAYDQKATGTQMGGSLRTLPAMRTHANWTFVALLVIVLQAISVYMAAALVLPDATGVTRTDA